MRIHWLPIRALVLIGITIPQFTFAQVFFERGLQPIPGFAGTPGGANLTDQVINLVNAFLILVAIIAAIALILAGLRFIISGGNEDQRAQATGAIAYTIVGLIVIGLSAVITNFVVNAIQ